MSERFRPVLFSGGSYDGKYIDVRFVLNRYVLVWFLPHPISLEDAKKLRIDEHVMYKFPEEVYRYDPKNHLYRFERIVHYNPQEI